MTKNRYLGTVGASALLAASALSGQAAAQAIMGHGAQPDNPRHQAALVFADLAESYTNGAVEINVQPAGQVGEDDEMIEAVGANTIQISANSQGSFAQVVPEVALFGLPFLFESLPQAYQVLDGEIGDLVAERAAEEGYIVLAWWDNGIRQISHVDKQIQSPEDLEGMDIRTPPSEMTVDMFEALGASPEPLAWGELPSALQAGTFQGQENPLVNIWTAELHEITPNIAMTGHKYESTPVIASEEWWNSLTPGQQDAVRSAAEQAAWYQRGSQMRTDAQLRSRMEAEGVTFTEPDIEPFVEATSEVYDKWEERFPELVPQLRAAADRAAQ